jgi:anti-sigma factor RsiW
VSGHELERLSAFLDGELPARERAEVEAHLAGCESCAAFVAQLKAVDEAARSLPTEAPDGYCDRLPARVRARIQERRKVGGSLPAWAWAAALLLAVLTPLTLRELRSPKDQARPAAMGQAAPAGTAQDTLEGAATPAPTAAPMPARRPEPPVPSAQAKTEAGPGFAPEPGGNAPANDITRKARAAPRNEAPAAPAETKAVAGGPARESAEAEAVAGGVAGGVVGGVVPPDVTEAAAPAGAALQQSARGGMQTPALVAVAPATVAADAESTFRRLDATRPATVEEWRRLRENWRSLAASFPDGPRADEARVRTIEAGFEAWKKGGGNEDEAVFGRDRDAYLARPDALQRERVRRLH